MTQKPEIIGLTGGSGSGKSTAAAILAELGCHVIDADKIGHDILKPGGRAANAVCTAFPGVIDESGAPNRKKLGEMVFADPEKLRLLCRITHPLITEIIREEIGRCEKAYAVIDAAALLGCEGIKSMCKKIIVVCADESVRINRITKRDHISYEQAKNRIDAQTPQSELVMQADIVWNNNGSVEELRRTVSGSNWNQ